MKLYYDGVCKMCTEFVSVAIRFSKPGSFVFIPLQKAQIKIPESFSNTVIVETNDGKLIGYADAISIVLQNMLLPFRILNILLKVLPKPFRNKGYEFIAKNRYKWFGKYDSCQILK